jgi:hypothetical protein
MDKMNKRTNKDLQNIHIKLKPGVDSGVPEGLAVPVPLVAPVVLI